MFGIFGGDYVRNDAVFQIIPFREAELDARDGGRERTVDDDICAAREAEHLRKARLEITSAAYPHNPSAADVRLVCGREPRDAVRRAAPYWKAHADESKSDAFRPVADVRRPWLWRA